MFPLDRGFTLGIAFVIMRIHIVNVFDRKVAHMQTTADVIEILARKLEIARILNDLKECKTLEDYQALVKKYDTFCNNGKI